MGKPFSFFLSSFPPPAMLSLPIPFSEAPSQLSSDAICTEEGLQETSLSLRETLSKVCPWDNSVTTPQVQSKSSPNRILSSSVSINQNLYFSPRLFRFLWFSLLPCLFPDCISTTEAKPRNLQLWNYHPPRPTRAEGWLAGFAYAALDRGSSLSTTPNDKYKALKSLSFLKIRPYIRA